MIAAPFSQKLKQLFVFYKFHICFFIYFSRRPQQIKENALNLKIWIRTQYEHQNTEREMASSE